MKRFWLVILILFVAAVGWHLTLASRMSQNAELLAELPTDEIQMRMKVNGITNVVTVSVEFETEADDVWSSFGETMAEGIMTTLGPQMLERELAMAARENFDILAIIFPYRVRVVTGDGVIEDE